MRNKFIFDILFAGLVVSIMCGCNGNAGKAANRINNPLVEAEVNAEPLNNFYTTDQMITSFPYSGAASDVSYNMGGEGQRLLGTYTTKFDSQKSARGHNIKTAADSINGKIVNPGETFSFNEAVGPTTKQNGYRLGRIFVNGKDSKGYGGGVCQVSSTLFNAVEQAGLPVVERHEHSKKVAYVPEGKDATTSYGVIDFKFTNNKDYPVKISSNIIETNVSVSLERV